MGRIEAVRTAAAVDRRTAERNMAAVGLWSVGGSVVWRGTTGGQRRLELARRGVGSLKSRSQKSMINFSPNVGCKQRLQSSGSLGGQCGVTWQLLFSGKGHTSWRHLAGECWDNKTTRQRDAFFEDEKNTVNETASLGAGPYTICTALSTNSRPSPRHASLNTPDTFSFTGTAHLP